MSSINNGHKPHIPGSVDPNDNSNLSKIAKKTGLFQGAASDDKAEDGKDTGKGKGGKTAPKGPVTKVGAAGSANSSGSAAGTGRADGTQGPAIAAGATNDTVDTVVTAASPGGTFTANLAVPQAAVAQDSILPTTTPKSFAKTDVDNVNAVTELASSPDRLNDSVNHARGTLARDIDNPNVTQATLEKDIARLTDALGQAGITEPAVAAVINDMVDPYGTGEQPSVTLQAAAKAKNIDLTADKSDPDTAKASLQKVLQQQPPMQAAVEMATANVMRTSALAKTDPSVALKDVAGGLNNDSSRLAALYAAAAKAGVDLTGKSDDATAAAKNKAATGKMEQAQKKASAAKAEAAHQDYNTGAGGGQGRSGGGAQTVSNGSSYPSIPKTGPGSSAGGWDTSGNEPIGPNPDNPVDFERDFGIKGGFTSESFDDLLARVPSLTAQYPNIKEILTSAANSVSPPIPPQLLLSTLGVETSYATNPNNGQDGPFQFIASTFDVYGKGDRTDMQDAANACANYYRTLLQENGGDLFAAMRDYNGDVNLGASNSYQKDQQSIFNGNMG